MVTMHPGEYFVLSYVEPYHIEAADLASCLGVPLELAAGFLAGQVDVTAELALRLSLAFDRSAESWLNMQNKFDLAWAEEHVDFSAVRPLPRVRKDAA